MKRLSDAEREEKSRLFAHDARLEQEIYSANCQNRAEKEAERHQVILRIEALLRKEGKL